MKQKNTTAQSKTSLRHPEMSVKITPFGPTQAALDEIARDLLRLTEVKKHLQNSRHRLLSIAPVETELKSSRAPAPPSRFRATIYDYTNNRALLIDGRLAQPRKVKITESASQPLPTRKEFEEAVEILERDKQLGPGIREQRLQPYPPMPPLLGEQLPDGRTERTIAVGLLPTEGERHHEIVGVNI